MNPDDNKIKKNEHDSYVDNDLERSVLYIAKGGKPRNDFEREIKKEIDDMPDGAVMDIPSDL